MSKLTKHQKDFVYQQACRIALSEHPLETLTSGSACLYWMHAGLIAMRNAGVKAIPACGTARFQMRSPEGHDDPTHLSFHWNDTSGEGKPMAAPVEGIPLPEMHCFMYISETNEVADFSVRYLPVFAKKIGYKFEPQFVPPNYYWERPDVLHPIAMYIPNLDATKLAMSVLKLEKILCHT